MKPGEFGVRVYPGPRMKRPCANCPFKMLNDGIEYLHPQRYEDILFAVCLGQPFWCHKTVYSKPYEGDEPSTYERHYRMCAGAVEAAEKLELTFEQEHGK